MTTTAPQRHPAASLAVARALTEILAPVVLIVALLFAEAIHASSSVGQGLLFGAITAFFAGGLPTRSCCSGSAAAAWTTATQQATRNGP